ncbi:MAG: hypothetical protein ACOC88_03405 [Candidatus Bipolaricaulota bacterium]
MAKLRDSALEIGRAYDKLKSYECDQEVTAGDLRIKAHVKFMKPRSIAVEYEEFTNPIEEFQSDLFGGPEFNGDDLESMRLVYDGSSTWAHILNKKTAIKKEGKQLYTPFAGVEIVGQLGFLSDLLTDYLLKDDGKGKINGRDVYKLGLKPKTRRRSYFLKEELFNLDSAQLAIDRETQLPLKITYRPGERDQLRYTSSQGGPLYVEYSDYKVDKPSKRDFQFDSSKIDKIFEEERLPREKVVKGFPITLDLEGVAEEGFQPAEDQLRVTSNREGDRKYTSIAFVGTSEEDGGSLQLLAGNYLSREMSRHRTFLSENGDPIDVDGKEAKVANRGENVKERLPNELKSDILEIGLESGGGFYYLLGQDVDREEMVRVLSALTSRIVRPG